MHLGPGPLCSAMFGFWVAEEEESSGGATFGCSRIGLQATPVPAPLRLRRLQLVSSLVARSLLMLQASWDMATVKRTSALSCVELLLG